MERELQNSIKEALQRTTGLTLVPPVCTGSFEGSRTGRRTGGAMEFADYRSYRQGDELRHVDWRLYARSDQLMVRRFAQETDPRCDIIIDCSASMDFYRKNAAAAGLGAIFAQSALNAGFSLQVWLLHDTLLKLREPETPLLWELPAKGSTESSGKAFETLSAGLFRNGVRILISDLFFDLSPETVMQKLGYGNSVVIQVLGDEELTPRLSGNISVTDPESGESKLISVSPETLEKYKANLEHFQRRYAETLNAYNSCFFSFNAASVAENWNMELFCREGILQ
jgi:hypothetical protein